MKVMKFKPIVSKKNNQYKINLKLKNLPKDSEKKMLEGKSIKLRFEGWE